MIVFLVISGVLGLLAFLKAADITLVATVLHPVIPFSQFVLFSSPYVEKCRLLNSSNRAMRNDSMSTAFLPAAPNFLSTNFNDLMKMVHISVLYPETVSDSVS